MKLVHGSGNVFLDFGCPNAEELQEKAILAAHIIRILDKKGLTEKRLKRLIKIRNDLDGFTIEYLRDLLCRLE
jgi:hypothetical protein